MPSRRPQINISARGPVTEGAGPSQLGSLLAEFEQALRQRGVPIDAWLQPGIPSDTVTSALAEVNLVPSEELLVWFGWHNGRAATTVQERATTSATIPNFVPASLEEAVRQYRESVLEFQVPASLDPELFYFGAGPGWLRLGSSLYGCAIDCSADPVLPIAIRSADPDFVLSAGEGLYQAVSLCTLVTWWLEGLDHGAYEWRGEQWAIHDELLPTSRKAVHFS